MFELASPWLLLFLFLPLLIWLFLPQAQEQGSAALSVPFYQAMQKIVVTEPRFAEASHALPLFYAIWILLVIALAGPRWVGDPIPLQQEGRNIMMVVDLSGSMAITDMQEKGRIVSRLFVVKQAAKRFVQQRVGDRVGLILFGTKAYLQTPLTFDRHSILMRIDDASPGLAGQTTSIGDALGLAVKKLQDVAQSSRVIILLTDGVNNSGVIAPLKAAQIAQSEGIKVYTIGLGGNESRGFFNFTSPNQELDEDTLKKIAQTTNGRYFRASDPQGLQEIYSKINQLEPVSQENVIIRPKQEYYMWPAGMALFLLMGWLAYQAFIHRRSQA